MADRCYVALVERGETGSWGISFPDFPGCISGVDSGTFEDVVALGAEALHFHIEGMIEDGLAIPEPHSLEQLKADPEFAEDFATAIVTTVLLVTDSDGRPTKRRAPSTTRS